MNSQNNDLFNAMMSAAMRASLVSALADFQNDGKIRENVKGAFRITDRQRRHMEYHPSIQSDVTDKDMLLLQIDHALDSGDEERFMLLTQELKGMGVLV